MHRALDDEEGTDGTVLVGPEGGFSADEVERAVEAGCTPVSLGARRLRAETAGIAVVNAVLLHAQKRTAA
jgi:16S rRNA (uracil1498-N3)-methyltransferase